MREPCVIECMLEGERLTLTLTRVTERRQKRITLPLYRKSTSNLESCHQSSTLHSLETIHWKKSAKISLKIKLSLTLLISNRARAKIGLVLKLPGTMTANRGCLAAHSKAARQKWIWLWMYKWLQGRWFWYAKCSRQDFFINRSTRVQQLLKLHAHFS